MRHVRSGRYQDLQPNTGEDHLRVIELGKQNALHNLVKARTPHKSTMSSIKALRRCRKVK